MLLEAVSVFKGTFESLHSDIHLNVAFISVLPGDILQHARTPVQVDSTGITYTLQLRKASN